jgi:lysophospholipase L1-like esterase
MRLAGASAALVAALLLAGCSATPEAAPPGPITGGATPEQAGNLDDSLPERYVALGDSFTAAPLVPMTELDSGCFRSDANYPSLLADSLNLRLTDVSCAGASTHDLTGRQATVQDKTVPPQLRVLDEKTDLVTLGIGGNDFGLFGGLVQTCLHLRSSDPEGAPCAESAVGKRLVSRVPDIGDNVERAIEKVQRRAPNARVILVGYPRLAPPDGGCPRLMPFADGDVAFGDRVVRALDRALRGAAESAGVEYLSLYAASEGHDVCSDEPWVNGRQTEPGVALAFHPLAEGARATAELLEELVARS